MQTAVRIAVPFAALMLIAGCASQKSAVSEPPTVRVTRLASTVISPTLIKFEAQIVIQNRSSSSLSFERVDYGVDLQDKPLLSDTFADMKRTKGGGRQTVTFPFQIAMKDILDQSIGILAEGAMRVAFRGTVFPAPDSGWGPMEFRDEVTIPLPRIPEVAFAGADGTPLSEVFRVRVWVRNPNAFPLTVNSVDTYLEINQQRYQMLHSEDSTEIGPKGTGTVTLRMENRPGKTLSMALSALTGEKLRFAIGGTIEARSPYGWVIIPVAVQGPN
jgi:hypothetical protein